CGNYSGTRAGSRSSVSRQSQRSAGKQPASLRRLRYALGPTHRGRNGDHRHRAEGIESDPQHEHLRSRRFVRSNRCGHERGHARQYRRDVVTRARLAGSQSASRVWLWPPVNGGSILCSLNVKTARWWRAIVSFTHLAREGRMTVTIGRRELLAALGGAALAWPLAASAQQGERVRRIGVLMNTAADETVFQIRVGAFLQGLALSGWT